MPVLARRIVEVYEIQSRSSLLSNWKEAATPFASKDGHGCEHKESLAVAPGYEWDGNWQLDLTNAANNMANEGDGGGGGGGSQGATDGEGWDYATSKDRFGPGKGAHRIPRDQGLKDMYRRRRWVRFMQPISDEKRQGPTPESKREMVRVLVDGLVRAQREVEKMGSRLGTPQDGEQVRAAVRDYLGKVQQAQAEVSRQIDALGDDPAAARTSRQLATITEAFAMVEADITNKLRDPIPAGAKSTMHTASSSSSSGGGPVSGGGGGAVSGGGPGQRTRGGAGMFVPDGGGGGDGFGNGGWGEGGGGSGEYVSRQQQEQIMAARLRNVGEDEMDVAIMQEREREINLVAENVSVLNDLFRDMAELVNDQQEVVDAVESNVDSAAERTQAGIVHLEKAIQHQKACVVS